MHVTINGYPGAWTSKQTVIVKRVMLDCCVFPALLDEDKEQMDPLLDCFPGSYGKHAMPKFLQLREGEKIKEILAESDKLTKGGSSSKKEKLLLVFEDLENEAKARRKMLDCDWGKDSWDAERWITAVSARFAMWRSGVIVRGGQTRDIHKDNQSISLGLTLYVPRRHETGVLDRIKRKLQK